MNNWVICDPQAKTPIGNNKNEGEGGTPVSTLFGSYVRYCQQSGFIPKAVKNFSPELLELLKTVVKWDVRKGRDNTAKYIEGVRLRVPEDDHIPTYDYVLEERLFAPSAESSADSGAESNPFPAVDFGICAESVLPPENQQIMDLFSQQSGDELVQESSNLMSIEDESAQPLNPPSCKGFDSTLESGTASGTENTAEKKSASTQPSSPLPPAFPYSVHQTVEFWHSGEKAWKRGAIAQIMNTEGYFNYSVVRYYAWSKSLTQNIFRADWLRPIN